jgi:DNA polymerase-4
MPDKNKAATTAWTLHIDGDGFFAYCEISRFPHLRGKPVAVGEERGIAMAMTYEAKRMGLTRGMPMFKIREQFPGVTVMTSHFELYDHYAAKLNSILESEVHTLERYSIDECFALVYLPSEWSKEQLHEWLLSLKQLIQKQIGLTYSFGLARTKVLAKTASKFQKPDGATVVTIDDEKDVLQKTSIESIWGIGWRLSRRFQSLRVKTAYEFSQWLETRVNDSFTLPIQELWHELNGRVMFRVGNEHSQAKSLQATRSFMPSSFDPNYIAAELLHNADVVFTRMRKQKLYTNGLSIYIKTTDRKYEGVAIRLPHYTNNVLDITETVMAHVKALIKKGIRYKATGITVWNLRREEHVPEDLFGTQQEVTEEGKLMKTVDAIRMRYGQASITVLSTMPSNKDRLQKSNTRKLTDNYIYGLPLPYLGEVK